MVFAARDPKDTGQNSEGQQSFTCLVFQQEQSGSVDNGQLKML
jgi:hypothetical protein